jgi:squalene-hopene/tetraprenyl-beta-curcumene cyclase
MCLSAAQTPPFGPEDLEPSLKALTDRLLQRRTTAGHWEGRLSTSALATAVAIVALATVAQKQAVAPNRELWRRLIAGGVTWLQRHQNADGGWGDTVLSRSNISTTALAWAALSIADPANAESDLTTARAEAWLREAAGDLTPIALRSAILRRYGNDRTFSVPILMVLALAGKLDTDRREAWQKVPQLPFELAVCPHSWFQHLRLPVVSYALPALIAIGHVRHHFAPTRNRPWRHLRSRLRPLTRDVLRAIQPASGGYLEAIPLTSFVVMSLASAGEVDSPVVSEGVRFLTEAARDDGSWPIDTNLATWVTTLAVSALAPTDAVQQLDMRYLCEWLLDQQSAKEHPFTHAAPGAWAWTPLSGGVPDADDTAGALLALSHMDVQNSKALRAAVAGAEWLLRVQNRNGGVPTFCRGWGTLPFDRSTPEITAHVLRAWSAWHDRFDVELQRRVGSATERAVAFLTRAQRRDGAWVPLWFGNEHAAEEENPTFGTARVLIGLQTDLARRQGSSANCRATAVDWLLRAQNADGGWGGEPCVQSSIEETGVALAAIAGSQGDADSNRLRTAIERGTHRLAELTSRAEQLQASAIGLYFAKLWYFEELYPLIFAISGLAAARRALHEQDRPG